MLEYNDRSTSQSRKEDSAGELGTNVFVRCSGVTGDSLWLLERPGGSFLENSKRRAHPDHIYHTPTDEGEHLVDNGLPQEKVTARDVSGPPRARCSQAWMSVEYLPANSASASSPSRGSRRKGTFLWLAVGRLNSCCSQKSANTSSQSGNSSGTSLRHESSGTNREGASVGLSFVGSQTKIISSPRVMQIAAERRRWTSNDMLELLRPRLMNRILFLRQPQEATFRTRRISAHNSFTFLWSLHLFRKRKASSVTTPRGDFPHKADKCPQLLHFVVVITLVQKKKSVVRDNPKRRLSAQGGSVPTTPSHVCGHYTCSEKEKRRP